MTLLTHVFTWLGAIAAVLCLTLFVLWLFDKTVSAVLRTTGWMGAIIRFMYIEKDDRFKLRNDPDTVREEAIRECMNILVENSGPYDSSDLAAEYVSQRTSVGPAPKWVYPARDEEEES